MNRQIRLLTLAVAITLIGAATAPVLEPAGPGTADPGIKTDGALTYDGIPETPPGIRAAVLKYQNVRSATFQDWMADGSMLIRTRFGQSVQLHRVVIPGGARTQLTFYEEPIRATVALPAGDRFIFTKDSGGSENYQGFLAGLTGPETQITEPDTRNEAFVCSADGRLIAWTRATPGVADWDIMLMKTEDPSSQRAVFSRSGIVVPLEFSPDGERLLFMKYISVTATKRFVLDLASGRATEILPESKEISFAGGSFTADGLGIYVLSDGGSDFTRLVHIDLGSGKTGLVSPPNLRWDVEAYDLTRDGKRLVYSVNEDGRSRVVILDLETGDEIAGPPLRDAVLGRLKFSPDGTKLAMTISTPSESSDVWSWDLAGRRFDRWTSSELGGLDPARMPSVGLVHVTSFDSLPIPMFVYRPRRPVEGRAPVIVLVHGGPEAQMRPSFDATIAYFTNELGAVVITPNVRGSTGYGRTFTKLDDGTRREDAVKDIGSILDWAAAQPDLDPRRIVVSGGSYGGYMALACLAHFNDRLVGAIDEVGISNWSTFLAHTEGYRRDARRAEYGDERDPVMRSFFDRISPLNMTDRMTRPLLVIQGANDPRVPRSEAEQIVSKLRARGNEVWYLLAADEGHGFRKKRNQNAQLEVETLFLRKVFGLDRSPWPQGE